MKRFSVVFLSLLLLFGCAHQGLEQTGAWNAASPAAGIQARYLDDAVRENNAAIEAVFGAMLTAGTAVTSTAAELNLLDGVTLALASVTSSAAELNILDGVTSSTAELNILDGVTSSAAELNILDGVTSSAAELNILDGVTSSAAELNILDGATSSTAEMNILDGATITATELNQAAGGVGVTIPRQIVISIGNWNMNTTASVTVPHGLSSTKIIGVRGVIRDDTDAYRYPIGVNPHDVSDDSLWIHIPTISSTTIKIVRASSSIFASSPGYDSASYNRGWIVVDYLN